MPRGVPSITKTSIKNVQPILWSLSQVINDLVPRCLNREIGSKTSLNKCEDKVGKAMMPSS